MNINRQITPYNHSAGRFGNSVRHIVLHTMVGGIDGAQSRFFNPNAAAAAHYGVGLNGEVRQWVSEGDTAWHAGNWNENTQSIGIEHEDAGNYNDPVRTDALYNSSIELCLDICRRYGLSADDLHIHKEFTSTGCPDGLDVNRIREGVRTGLAGGQAAPSPVPGIGYVAINGTIHVTVPVMRVRTGPGRQYQYGMANTNDGDVHYGVTLTVTGLTIQGEEVDAGNPVWLRSLKGNWFYSGCTDFDWHSALPQAPAAPAYNLVNQVGQVVCHSGAGVNLRTEPNRTAAVDHAVEDGTVLNVVGHVDNGEAINGDSLWWKTDTGLYVSNAVAQWQEPAPAPVVAPAPEPAPTEPVPVETPPAAPATPTAPTPVPVETPIPATPKYVGPIDGISAPGKFDADPLLNYQDPAKALGDLADEIDWSQYKKAALTGRQRFVAIVASFEGLLLALIQAINPTNWFKRK